MKRTRLLVGCSAAGGSNHALPGRFSIRLEGGTITHIGDLTPLPGDEVLDLAGAYLAPGLVDAHVHLGLAGEGVPGRQGVGPTAVPPGGTRPGGEEKEDEASTDPASNARRHLAAGVTAVRDLGGTVAVGGAGVTGGIGSDAPRRAGAIAPDADGPRYRDPTGPGLPRVVLSRGALTRRGRYGAFLGTALGPDDDLAAAVRTRVAAGAGVVKVILTGSVDFGRGTADPPHFSLGELRLMIDVAHSSGLPVAVHANGAVAVRLAAEAGADSVEHGILADERALETLAARGCVWVPTLTPLHALGGPDRWPSLPRILRTHEEMVLYGHAYGVRIAAGTDAGSPGVPHGSLLTEIALLRRAGLSPAAARESAVEVGAAMLRLPTGYGHVSVGARTDLVWFERDPFECDSPQLAAGVRPVGIERAEP